MAKLVRFTPYGNREKRICQGHPRIYNDGAGKSFVYLGDQCIQCDDRHEYCLTLNPSEIMELIATLPIEHILQTVSDDDWREFIRVSKKILKAIRNDNDKW